MFSRLFYKMPQPSTYKRYKKDKKRTDYKKGGSKTKKRRDTKKRFNPLLGQVTHWVTRPIKSELFPKK